MDEMLQELENELINLRPRRTSPALEARIEAALVDAGRGQQPVRVALPAQPRPRIRPTWPLAAAALLVAGLAVALWPTPAARPASVPPSRTAAAAAEGPGAVAVAAKPASAPAPAARYRPVGAASVLYDMQEDGDVYLSGQTPVRRVRYRYVDTYTWKNPATNASLKWSVPREEIRVLPASLH